ncbi:unnamed protein product [Adineta steineri]|uniref:Uncharacterized protein n=1 Tax=Adineta steineri TaxID=433720 RepID=A0A818SJE6_9BILA|nr:unnamed protein product [Adineta steineri]CAF3669941.1 unnamed protein product [Adineta steineri]
MLFLGGRTRNITTSGRGLHDESHTQKVGHSCIIGGCLSVTTGLILIIIGVISEVRNTTFIGVGVISLGVGFFLTTLVCFYAKLDICYNNWAYRTRITPAHIETPQPAPAGAITTSPFVPSVLTTEKQQTLMPDENPSPTTVVSHAEIHKILAAPSIKTTSMTFNSDNVP